MRARDRISLLIGGAALLVSILFVGAAHRWVQAVVAVLVAGALGFHLVARRRLPTRSPLLVLIGIAIGLTLLQLVPVPEVVRSAVTGHGEILRADGSLLAGTDPWPCISLDPAGTLRSLAFLIILFGVAVIALRLATSERSRFVLLGGVAAACGIAALVTGLHSVLALDSLFGIYAPVHATPPVLGPLLNSNHLGSLMSVGAVTSVGIAFHHRQPVQLRVVWIVNALGCAVVCFATASRGAALALLLGLAATGAMLAAEKLANRRSRSRRQSILTSDVPIAVVVLLGLGLAVFTSAGKVADQLDNTTLAELDQPVSKYAAWRTSFQLVGEAPVLGIGRGATEPVFTRVFEPAGQVTFSHLENEYVQSVVEWGIPGAVALGIAFGWCVLVTLRRWRSGALSAAALGALAGVLFQSTVDFGVELLGLAIPVTILGATVLHEPLTSQTSRWTRVLRIGLIVGLLAAAIALFSPATRTVQEDHDERSVTNEQLADVIERHPLDYLAFGRMASVLAKDNDPRAVRFLNHALTLHPTHPGLHTMAARLLVDTGRPFQAALEFSLALKATRFPYKLLEEILRLLPNVAHASAAIPVDYFNPDLVIRSLNGLKRRDVALSWLSRVIAQPQHNTDMIDRLYALATEQRAYDVALVAARTRLKLANTSTSRVMLARVHFQRGEHQALLEVIGDVARWRGPADEHFEAWLMTCDVVIAKRQWDRSLECLHRLDGSGLAARRRDEILKRIRDINDQRTIDARIEALEAMKRAVTPPPKTP